MSNDEFADLSNKELNELALDQAQLVMEKIASSMSKIVRSFPDKKTRIEALNKPNYTNSILIRIYNIAKENQDYETCDAVKDIISERGRQLPN